MKKKFKNRDKATDSWQVLRMQGEIAKGFDILYDLGPSVGVFGSARMKEDNPWYTEAFKFGKLMSATGFNVITGGGPGVMEAVNKGVKQNTHPNCGKSIGIGIELPFEQGMNEYLDTEMECRYFFIRKVLIIKYAQAFVAFPGGIGTLDEIFETITLAQTGQVPKYPIILMGTKHWNGLLEWIKFDLISNNLFSAKDMDLFRVVDTAEEAVSKILEFHSKYRPDNIVNF